MKLSEKYYTTHDYRIWHEPFGEREYETFNECRRGCGARISELAGSRTRSTDEARKPCTLEPARLQKES